MSDILQQLHHILVTYFINCMIPSWLSSLRIQCLMSNYFTSGDVTKRPHKNLISLPVSEEPFEIMCCLFHTLKVFNKTKALGPFFSSICQSWLTYKCIIKGKLLRYCNQFLLPSVGLEDQKGIPIPTMHFDPCLISYTWIKKQCYIYNNLPGFIQWNRSVSNRHGTNLWPTLLGALRRTSVCLRI